MEDGRLSFLMPLSARLLRLHHPCIRGCQSTLTTPFPLPISFRGLCAAEYILTTPFLSVKNGHRRPWRSHAYPHARHGDVDRAIRAISRLPIEPCRLPPHPEQHVRAISLPHPQAPPLTRKRTATSATAPKRATRNRKTMRSSWRRAATPISWRTCRWR